jgi:FkbM family methyltransferase
MQISQRCREYEKQFPLVPSGGDPGKKDGWTRWKQYSTPDHLRSTAKMFWNFGVSREIRYEIECRRVNKTAKILTFDPTPLSKETTDRANSAGFKIIHNMKAYDSEAGQTKKFYDVAGDGKCFQLDEPEKYENMIEVQTTNLKEIADQHGAEVDIIKLDVEGRWYEMLNEILDLSLPAKVILCECEMDIGDTDDNFDRLDEIVEKYQSRGYKVWTNRIGKKQNIELIFTNNI